MYYTQLRLDPLPPEGAEALLGALLGADAGLEPLTRGFIARTEGNPFFLEESVRALVETGALLGERGAYRLARPLPTIQVPATVQAVLAARIDRLPPADKTLLQTASVVGKDVPFVLLQAMAEPTWRAPLPSAACSMRETRTGTKPSGSPRRLITCLASSRRVWGWRISTTSGGT